VIVWRKYHVGVAKGRGVVRVAAVAAIGLDGHDSVTDHIHCHTHDGGGVDHDHGSTIDDDHNVIHHHVDVAGVCPCSARRWARGRVVR
jgi:hypothetical protein